MTDEGYNCEWSQELKLDQSFNEYLNAWIALHILKDKSGWGTSEGAGFIFNMSVGYNLEGILSQTVQRFLDKVVDCSKEKAEKIERLAKYYPRVKELNIPDRMSDNITISTMHGCPHVFRPNLMVLWVFLFPPEPAALISLMYWPAT